MERREREKPDKTQIVPEPSDPKMFLFIEDLFTQDQMPEQLELRQASGRGARNYSDAICPAEVFKPNAQKPGREKLVALSNKFVDLAQHDCDQLGSQQGYAVLAKHHAKGAGFYCRYYFKLQPQRKVVTRGDDGGASFDDDEELTHEQRSRFDTFKFMLDHSRQNDENDRLRQDQYSQAMGDMLVQQKQIIDMLMEDRREMQRENREQMKENRELFKQLDESLSRRQERDLAQQAQQIKLGMLQDAFQFGKQVIPIALSQLTGKQLGAGTPETLAVSTFLQGLSEEQADALFGKPVDGSINPNGGIFTAAQTSIFVGVAQNQMTPDVIDKLVPGGEHGITPDQIAKAQTVLREQQYMPLVAMIMTRKK